MEQMQAEFTTQQKDIEANAATTFKVPSSRKKLSTQLSHPIRTDGSGVCIANIGNANSYRRP